jgi:arylsulfatase A-like enzyme
MVGQVPRARARAAGLAAALVCGSAAWSCHQARPRPGVPPKHAILITLAGLRADHCSSYLYVRPTTTWPVDPGQVHLGRNLALDDLAETGVMFVHAFAAASDAVGSLAALHTGRAPVVGRQVSGLEQEALTLAERLKAAGMRTVAFVAGDDLAVAGGFDQGFDTFIHTMTDGDALTKALPWIAEQDWGTGQGLFLWIHLSGPQPPYTPLAQVPTPGKQADELSYSRLFTEPKKVSAELASRDYASLFVDPRYKGDAVGSHDWLQHHSDPKQPQPTRADVQRILDLYDGEVAQTAAALRSFLLALREVTDVWGLWEDAALVIAGVNGAELFEHKTFAPTVFAPSARVPLVLRHPGSLTGTRALATAVDTADVTPTLLEWLGVDPMAQQWNAQRSPRDGRSLLALTDSYAAKPFDRRACVGLGPKGAGEAMLRDGRFSLLWRPRADGSVDYALFDRDTDPLELEDVSALEPHKLAELKTELTRLLAPPAAGAPPP